MTGTYRIAASDDHKLSGRLIDRDKPVRFHLNGQALEGFQGDTILSAALANGVDSFGEADGFALALSADMCPPIYIADQTGNIDTPFPMDRTLIGEGLIYETHADRAAKGRPGLVARTFTRLKGRQRSLDTDPMNCGPLPGPFMRAMQGRSIQTDVLIIGGGIAGMSAAQAAAHNGQKVILVERCGTLGGAAGFFGDSGSNRRVDDVVNELVHSTLSHEQIEVYTYSLAFAAEGGGVLVHRVRNDATQSGRLPFAETLQIKAETIVLATGVAPRLSLFSGNRLPCVVDALHAFRMAQDYGVGPGENTVIATGTNAAVNFALRLAEAGLKVCKIVDSRSAPQSRFYDFSRAYALPTVTGTKVAGVQQAKSGLTVLTSVSAEQDISEPEVTEADALVISSGYEPNMALWIEMSGQLIWAEHLNALSILGEIEGVIPVGAVSGITEFSDIQAHAKAALSTTEIEDLSLPQHQMMTFDDVDHLGALETVDDAPTIAPQIPEGAPIYFSSAQSLGKYGVKQNSKRNWMTSLLGSENGEDHSILTQPQPFSVKDISAMVRTGQLKPEFARSIAAERCVRPLVVIADWVPDAIPKTSKSDIVPDYLNARFGRESVVVELVVQDGGGLDVGALLFEGTTGTEIEAAVGVVYSFASEEESAVCARAVCAARITEGKIIYAQMAGRMIECRVVVPDPLREPASGDGHPDND